MTEKSVPEMEDYEAADGDDEVEPDEGIAMIGKGREELPAEVQI